MKLPIALPRLTPPKIDGSGLRSICSSFSLPSASRSCFTTSTDRPVVFENSSILPTMESMVDEETLSRSSKIVTQSELSLNSSNCSFALFSLLVFSAPSLARCRIFGSSMPLMSSSCLSYRLFSSSICCSIVAFFSMRSAIKSMVSFLSFSFSLRMAS